MRESQIRRLKQAQAFFILLAILSAIMALPLVGYLLSIMSIGTVHLFMLAVAIVTLIFALRANAPRTGTMLVMIAVIPGIISAVLMYNGIRIGTNLGLDIAGPLEAYQGMYSGELSIFFIGFNIGIVSWAAYAAAAALLFLNVYSVRKRYKGIEAGFSFLPMGKKMRGSAILNDEKIERAMGFDDDEWDDEAKPKKSKKKKDDKAAVSKKDKKEKTTTKNKKTDTKTKAKTTKAKTKTSKAKK